MVPEDEIEPVRELPDAETLPEGDAPLDQAVVIKLNGGLGTSMGMDARQVAARGQGRPGLPRRDRAPGARAARVERRAAAARADELLPHARGLAGAARALRRARLRRAVRLRPAQGAQAARRRARRRRSGRRTRPRVVPARPRRHLSRAADLGDARALLEHGYRYAFMSNADNLGAVLDPRILAWIAAEGLPYVVRGSSAARMAAGRPAQLQGQPRPSTHRHSAGRRCRPPGGPPELSTSRRAGTIRVRTGSSSPTVGAADSSTSCGFSRTRTGRTRASRRPGRSCSTRERRARRRAAPRAGQTTAPLAT